MEDARDFSEDGPVAAVQEAQHLDWEDGLRMVWELRQLGSELEGHFVSKARSDGVSWEQIGLSLGVSRQAAHAKHHR